MSDHPAPLTPLEAELEALLQIELAENLEATMDDLDNFRRSSLSLRQVNDLTAEVNTLRTALRRLCLAVERLARENWDGEMDGDTWTAYEAAREVIGARAETFAGGEHGCHIHWLDFNPEEDVCGWCEEAEPG